MKLINTFSHYTMPFHMPIYFIYNNVAYVRGNTALYRSIHDVKDISERIETNMLMVITR